MSSFPKLCKYTHIVMCLVTCGILVGVEALAQSESIGHTVGSAYDPTIFPTTTRIQVIAIEEALFRSSKPRRISSVIFKDGDQVATGETILTFECDVEQGELARAQAFQNRKETELSAALRLQGLGSGSGTSVKLRQAELAQAKVETSIASSNVDACTIRAPFSGQIADLVVKSHYSIAAGQDLLKIINNERLEVKTIIPVFWLEHLKIGDEFEINIDGRRRNHIATVERFGGYVDPVSQTISMFGSLPEDTKGFLAGMSGQANFSLNVKSPR